MPLPRGMKIAIDRADQVAEAIRALGSERVMVGIPSDRAARKDGEPINNAALGYIHENGAPEVRIPPRPWLVPGTQSVQPEIIKRLKGAAQTALEGDPKAVHRSLLALGLVVVSAVRKYITTGPFIPLSPVTLAKRKARGFKGTRPLIETGQLRNAVTFVIRKVTGG